MSRWLTLGLAPGRWPSRSTDAQSLPRVRARDEQQAALLLQVEPEADRVVRDRGDGPLQREGALAHADYGGAPEIEALHTVHRADPRWAGGAIIGPALSGADPIHAQFLGDRAAWGNVLATTTMSSAATPSGS